MNLVLHPWQLLLVGLASWVNRQQQAVIEYLRTENQVLREAHGKKRIRLNDNQRRRLAIKGKMLGRRMLGEIGTIVTPDTILRWHRTLIARKWDYSDRRRKAARVIRYRATHPSHGSRESDLGLRSHTGRPHQSGSPHF